ncbi:MAG: transposase [Tannerella sp.]|nr:transposase [Tannerella sp.]
MQKRDTGISLMPMRNKILLRKRSVIETINDVLKNICDVKLSRHPFIHNFIYALDCCAWCVQLFRQKACNRCILNRGTGKSHCSNSYHSCCCKDELLMSLLADGVLYAEGTCSLETDLSKTQVNKSFNITGFFEGQSYGFLL